MITPCTVSRCTCRKKYVDEGCPEHGIENERVSARRQILDKLVRLGYLKDYAYMTKYEEKMRTSETITLVFPMGATLTISGVSSGSSENVYLELEVGHQLLEDK
jgi:hypothetical protein